MYNGQLAPVAKDSLALLGKRRGPAKDRRGPRQGNARGKAGLHGGMAALPHAVNEPLVASTRTAIEALRGRDSDLPRVARRLAKLLTVTGVASAVIGGAEAAIEHYRGSFNQWSMWTPIACSAALLVASAAALSSERAFRKWMPAASWLMIADGLAGTFYHARGIHRRPGGFHEPIFNLAAGAPIFAPLILAGAGAVGLLALVLDKSAAAQSEQGGR